MAISCEPQVGRRRSFFIDLARTRPASPGRYLYWASECDGANLPLSKILHVDSRPIAPECAGNSWLAIRRFMAVGHGFACQASA